MNIQFSSLFSLQGPFFSPLKEKASFSLTNKQKAVMVVAFLALLLVAACYSLLGRCCNFRASNISDDADDEKGSVSLDTGMVIEGFPDEILTQIFKKLDPQSWRQLGNTNKHLNQISKTPEVIGALISKEIPFAQTTQRLELAKQMVEFWKRRDYIFGDSLTRQTIQKNLVLEEILSAKRLELAKQARGYLKKFSFEGLTLTKEALQELLRVCPDIDDLDLSFQSDNDCLLSGLTAADLVLLPKLKSLKLGNWNTLTDADLTNLFQIQTSLESIDLKGCHLVTNASLMHLPESLKVLHLGGCPLVTYKGIKRFQNLESLVLYQDHHHYKLNIGKLPRSLESLALHNFIIDIKDLEQLPQNLKILKLASVIFLNRGF